MGLDLDRIREKFSLYSGEDPAGSGPRERLCAQLCGECADRAAALLEKAGAKAGERGAVALESWAAAEAFYQLALADEAVTPASVSADGVQITQGERSLRAKALAEEKRRAVESLLGEGAFYFGRV